MLFADFYNRNKIVCRIFNSSPRAIHLRVCVNGTVKIIVNFSNCHSFVYNNLETETRLLYPGILHYFCLIRVPPQVPTMEDVKFVDIHSIMYQNSESEEDSDSEEEVSMKTLLLIEATFTT